MDFRRTSVGCLSDLFRLAALGALPLPVGLASLDPLLSKILPVMDMLALINEARLNESRD